jgi:hypothetical protein
MTLQSTEFIETHAYCQSCSAGLSNVEFSLYGYKCMFCSSPDETLPLFNIYLRDYLLGCYYDWKIYQKQVKLWKIYGRETARKLLIGCLAEAGSNHVFELDIKHKKVYLKILQRYINKKWDLRF